MSGEEFRRHYEAEARDGCDGELIDDMEYVLYTSCVSILCRIGHSEEEEVMPRKEAPVKWAPKVRQDKIRRLYEKEAMGICDEELIDDVGYALYMRCVSILEATAAANGRAKCHGCGGIIVRQKIPDELLHCNGCGWELDWKTYHKSMKKKQILGNAALPFFQEYVDRFFTARSPREKLLLIDRVIHEFHWNLIRNYEKPLPTRATAANLIDSEKAWDVYLFLNGLTYGQGSAPETMESRDRWRELTGLKAEGEVTDAGKEAPDLFDSVEEDA